jgi:ferredoxin
MFCVTRQQRWDDGANIVEITQGGIDYTNPDALCQKYSGEFEEFLSLEEATETAIEIAQQWKKDSPSLEITIACGATSGYTAHFDELPLTDETFYQLRLNAKDFDEKQDKCSHCGCILGGKNERYKLLDPFDFDEEFCSENCANQAYEFHMEDLREASEDAEAMQDNDEGDEE